jgi:hypothetical protein
VMLRVLARVRHRSMCCYNLPKMRLNSMICDLRYLLVVVVHKGCLLNYYCFVKVLAFVSGGGESIDFQSDVDDLERVAARKAVPRTPTQSKTTTTTTTTTTKPTTRRLLPTSLSAVARVHNPPPTSSYTAGELRALLDQLGAPPSMHADRTRLALRRDESSLSLMASGSWLNNDDDDGDGDDDDGGGGGDDAAKLSLSAQAERDLDALNFLFKGLCV